MRIDELRQQSGNEEQRLWVCELNEQALEKKIPMFDDGDFRLDRRGGTLEGRNDQSHANVEEIDRTDYSEHSEGGRSGGKQRAETKCNANKENGTANLNTRDADETRSKPVTCGLRH